MHDLYRTKLNGVFVIEISKIGDERGFFGRSWSKNEMEEHGLNANIAHINTSLWYRVTYRPCGHFRIRSNLARFLKQIF
mgnify:CR=1 FL=1